ncbi:MAG: glycine cleavage system protein GcvH [Alphaproteobacteria bacterium]|nr:glycine cleavage system protein GcvH [Pseudomonadota bacterium]TDI68341.1 MAG: glycine cleavage system protein GcvH [Alphaproteobacteria bacterium]
MAEQRYTSEHEWVRMDGDIATVGISQYAQEQLGDVVYVELPETGRKVAPGDDMAVVESVKAASEVYAPVGGVIVEVNAALADAPEKINQDAEGAAWLVRLSGVDGAAVAALMDGDAYRAYLEGLD